MKAWGGVAGKHVVITGATGGIGLAAAKRLRAEGATLTIVARDEIRGRAEAERLGADVVVADLSIKAQVRRAAQEILRTRRPIDVLINNAGVLMTERIMTPDWLETTWAVNHVAPFLLANLLLDRIISSAPARIITTASDAHRRATIPFDDLDGAQVYSRFSMAGPGYLRYAQSKLANMLFTLELARRLDATGVTVNCFHPGLVASGISRHLRGPARLTMKLVDRFSRSPEKGAETLVWLAESSEVTSLTGKYFADCSQAKPAGPALDAAAARKLWELTEEQAGLGRGPCARRETNPA